MYYYFRCQASTREVYVFGLMPGQTLTEQLHFLPKPGWTLEYSVKNKFRRLFSGGEGDGSIQHYTTRLVVLFTRETARLAYLKAEADARADKRFDPANLEILLVTGHDNLTGLVTEKKAYADLLLPGSQSHPPQRNLAAWAHSTST